MCMSLEYDITDIYIRSHWRPDLVHRSHTTPSNNQIACTTRADGSTHFCRIRLNSFQTTGIVCQPHTDFCRQIHIRRTTHVCDQNEHDMDGDVVGFRLPQDHVASSRSGINALTALNLTCTINVNPVAAVTLHHRGNDTTKFETNCFNWYEHNIRDCCYYIRSKSWLVACILGLSIKHDSCNRPRARE